MDTQNIIAIGGLLVALVGLITGFFMQRDAKKIRDLERDNKKYRGRLVKALNAIKGYQLIEEELAQKENLDTATYRRNIRKINPEYFSSAFLTPGNVDEMMNDLENN